MTGTVHDPGRARRARVALAVVFCVHGSVAGSLASRMPWIQEHAGVGAGRLGLSLAFPAIGASVAMPLAGGIAHRFGTRAAQRALLALWTLALVLPSVAPGLVALCGTLFVFGATSGMADVVMNTLGVELEERLGTSVLPGLHGMWSTGALLGSAVGVLAAHLGTDARVHHALMAAVLTAAGLVAAGRVPDVRPEQDEEPPPRFALPPRSALLIGAVGFCAIFAEGASLDWSAVYLHDILGTTPALAAASTTGFTLTMAVARMAGNRVVDHFGAVRTVRAGGVLATTGGLCVVVAPGPLPAVAGFAMLGLGIAVVVPLAFAAAGRSGPRPGQAIAGVATITYTAGLVAPSAIGTLADATSLVVSFGLVTALAFGLLIGAGALRPGERRAGRGTGRSAGAPAAAEPAERV